MNFPAGYLVVFVLTCLGASAFWHKMKLWCVVVQGFNLLFATLMAIGLFEQVANALDGALGMMAYYNDMLSFMLIFLIVLAVLMFVTRRISGSSVFFEDKTDKIAKWATLVVVLIGFGGTGAFVFYETMPEKPKDAGVPPTMKLVDVISKGALKPLTSDSTFDSAAFVSAQKIRNAGVYTAVNQEDGTWKFDGDSPNAQ